MTTAPRTGETTFTTPSEREVVAARIFEAPRELVWKAYTEPEHLRQWLLGPDGWTMSVCEVDLRPGGAYRYVWRQEDGTELTISGVHKEVEPPERLVATESWGGDWPEALNTLVFEEEDGRTTLTVTVLYPSQEARDAALATGMTDGWSQGYDRLDEHLRSLAA
jgi:uncharacterized protein YndB with AHSA1/START domain